MWWIPSFENYSNEDKWGIEMDEIKKLSMFLIVNQSNRSFIPVFPRFLKFTFVFIHPCLLHHLIIIFILFYLISAKYLNFILLILK